MTASSEIPPNFSRLDDYIVDGSGFTGATHANGPPDGTMWLSTGTAFGGDDPDPSVTFNLGACTRSTASRSGTTMRSLSPGSTLTGRGVNQVTVQYGNTPALGSTVAGITNFAQADGSPRLRGEVFNTFTPFNAQYIRFDIDSNHGGDNNFYGLSEGPVRRRPRPGAGTGGAVRARGARLAPAAPARLTGSQYHPPG